MDQVDRVLRRPHRPDMSPYAHTVFSDGDSLANDDADSRILSDSGSDNGPSPSSSRSPAPPPAPAADAADLKRNISVLGPRMRIHSLAPWETDWIPEQEPDDDDPKSETRSLFGSKTRRRKAKESKTMAALKGISLASVSPRFLRAERPSVDSPTSPLHPTAQAFPTRDALPNFTEPYSRPSSQASFRTPPNVPIPPLPRRAGVHPPTGDAPAGPPQSRRPTAGEGYGPPEEQAYHPFANPDNILSANRLSTIEPAPFSADTDIVQNSSDMKHNTDRAFSSLPQYAKRQTMSVVDNPATRSPASQGHSGARVGNSSSESHELRELEDSHSGRTLKQKKSGILRLFNKDKEPNFQRKRAQTLTSTFSHGSFVDVPPVPDIKAISSSSSQPESIPPRSPGVSTMQVRHHSLSPLQIGAPIQATRRIASSPRGPSSSLAPSASLTIPTSAPPSTSNFPALTLRPVSGLFSEHFTDHIIQPSPSRDFHDSGPSRPNSGSTGPSTGFTSPLPLTPRSRGGLRSSTGIEFQEHEGIYSDLQDQVIGQKRAWMYQIMELERQIQELKEEVESLRGGERCQSCGRGGLERDGPRRSLHRPRVHTPQGSRSLFGGR